MSKQIAICIDTPALGDTLAAIPTLRKLSKAYESQLIVFSSKPFLFEGHPLVSIALKLDDPLRFAPNLKVYRTFMPIVGKTYDLKGEQVEFRSSNMDIRQFHAVSLGFTLSEDEMEMDLYIEKERELGFEDYVIIHPTHTWPTRTWDQAKWQELVNRLNEQGIPVVAVGRDSHEVGTFSVDKPVMQLDIKLGVDLLNDPTNDPAELRWMMNHRARAIVTMDSGLLHIAGTTDVNIIQLGSSIDPKLRAPYRKGTQDYKYTYVSGGCDIFCSSNMKYNIKEHGTIQAIPPQIYCLDGKPTFECHPSVDQVLESVLEIKYKETKIPRIIHQTFKSFDALDQNILECVNQLKEQNPDWEYRFYSNADCIEFIKTNYDIETLDLYLSINESYGAARADFFRYLVMYKEGGAYFDIKSGTTDRLSNLIHPETEYILTHWPGKDFADELNYELGEFQNWHIITIPGHPFLARTIELVKENLRRLKIENVKIFGKEAVLRTTGPIVYSKAILELLDTFEHTTFTSPIKHHVLESEAGLKYSVSSNPHWNSYKSYALETSNLLKNKFEKAYITHCNEAYLPIVQKMVETVREFSKLPIIVYVLNSDAKVAGTNIITHRLDADIREGNIWIEDDNGNKYVERGSHAVYDVITKKVNATIHALNNYANTVVYLDGDSIATPKIDELFDYNRIDLKHPLFTHGLQGYMMLNGKGNPFVTGPNGEEQWKIDLSLTLEQPLCDLLNVDNSYRLETLGYVQTGYFVANRNSLEFLKEWQDLCDSPSIKNNDNYYTPFHEETIVNVLMWKYKYSERLPLCYINVNDPATIDEVYTKFEYDGSDKQFRHDWLVTPGNIDHIKVMHGEKRPDVVDELVNRIKKYLKPKDMSDKKKLLFLAPHLSTGGMPQFVLKRVEAMLNVPEYEVYLIEYTQYSNIYNVQRDQLIEKLGKRFNSLGFLDSIDITERGQRLRGIIEAINPDIIHIDECPESFDGFNKLEPKTMDWLYNKPWKIVETSHNIWFDSANKVNDPDMYMMCTPYHLETFGERAGLKPVIEYPIIDKRPSTLDRARNRSKLGFSIDKIHVLNVGLWTQGKNQAEGINIARIVEASHPGQFQFHFVGNQAENFEHYWGPLMQDLPTNVTVWGERSDVDSFMSACDAFMFNSNWECSPLALREAIGHGLITFSRDLPQYKDMFTPYIVPFTNDLHENVDQLIRTLKSSEAQGKNIPHDDFKRFTQQHIDWYQQVLEAPRDTKTTATPKEIKWHLEWIDGPRLTIDQTASTSLRAEFWDGQDLVYAPRDLKQGHWYQPARHWWTEWTIKIWSNDQLVHSQALTLEGQTVTVEMASSSLGDTLSFMGQLHSVIDTHKLSRLYVKTHKPWLFDKAWYLERGIEIIDWSVPNKGAVMTIGVFYTMEEPWKRSEHKYDWRQIPLGKIAADRLGVPYKEQRPQLAPEFYARGPHDARTRSVVIATQSTAQAKYWNNPTGWQEVIDWCNVNNIKVLHASKEGTKLTGVQQLPEELALVAAAINNADMFIGISSGLSWFAWALGAKVVIISGFTDPYVEFEDAIYINNHQVCHGCWGWDTFDKGDWNWCPLWKGTQRQFECSKTIGSDRVIEVITKQVYG